MFFNIRPDSFLPGFRVQPPKEPEVPGFRMNPDGSIDKSVSSRAPQTRTLQNYNPLAIAWRMLPPEARASYASIPSAITKGIEELSTGAAVRDAVNAYTDMNRAAWSGRGWDAARSGLQMLTAAAGVVPINRAIARTGQKVIAHQTAEAIPGRGTGHLENMIEAPPAAREAFTTRVSDALSDPAGIDVLNKAAGLHALPTQPTTGAFRATPTSPVEINPGFAMGAKVPMIDKGGALAIDPASEQALRTTATMRGAMTAQLGNPYNAQMSLPTGDNLVVPLDSKVSPERMQDFVNRYGTDRVVPADTGSAVNVLNFGDRLATSEARDIASRLSGNPANYRRSREVSDPTMSYVDLSTEWLKPPGSRDITRRMLDEVERLNNVTPGGLATMDNAELREAAGKLHTIYDSHAQMGRRCAPT
ncbi:MAG: hypothetical protein GEV13_21135 [Rhodospirillales bacterium]|nr:hypothetical protein [Rhodospirillales bacterium]